MDIRYLIGLIVALVTGATGIAAIYQFFVRPRVYRAVRDYRTVGSFRPEETTKIEAALRAQNIPTAYAEVEWWNRGRRAAKDIAIELRAPGPISDWRVEPPDDLGATWECTLDPKRTSSVSEKNRIRIQQSQLMPGKRCNLLVGYDVALSDSESIVTALQDDRLIVSPQVSANVMGGIWGMLIYPLCFGPSALFYWLARFLPGNRSWIQLVGLVGGLPIGVLLANWIGQRIYKLGPGKASWERKTQLNYR